MMSKILVQMLKPAGESFARDSYPLEVIHGEESTKIK